ncbi:Uncharacterized RING finger protein P32A8.03c [Linum perenne]
MVTRIGACAREGQADPESPSSSPSPATTVIDQADPESPSSSPSLATIVTDQADPGSLSIIDHNLLLAEYYLNWEDYRDDPIIRDAVEEYIIEHYDILDHSQIAFFEEEFLNAKGEQREGEAEDAWSTEMSRASDLPIGKLERLESIEGEDECCSICLERMSLLRKLIRLGCKHVFHESCLVTWLCTSTYCRLCRFCVSE